MRHGVKVVTWDGLITVAGFGLVVSGALVPSAAGASFPGAANGNVGFIAICNPTIGQPVYSLDPNGGPPPTYSCPGGAAPNYTQSTAGSTDSMPFFSADGATMYFASSRANNGNNAIYSVPYPSTVLGAPGSQTDGAAELTFPIAGNNSFNDYAPTVSGDATKLAFIRCNGTSTSCTLDTQSPISGGVPAVVPTAQPLALPDSSSGAANRPEFDPADPTQILYVGTDAHIHLVSLTGAFAERDLSVESGVGSTTDGHPDWSPDGTKLVFDTSRTGGHKIYVMTMSNPATAAPLWSSDPGTEIEPVYAPTSPTTTKYVWTKLGVGSNLVIDWGTSVGSPVMLASLTNNRTNNSQSAWPPVPLGAQTPEAPLAVLLPIVGGGLVGSALTLRRRRERSGAGGA